MDVKKIESLAKLMQETGLTALELTEGESVLKLERKQEVIAAAPVAVAAAPVAGPEALGVVSQPEAVQTQQEGTMVLSPTVGVFYAAPSPDARPFVEVGDQVKKGDTLCIIEAMKLMNEIPAEVDGTVAEICVGNGQVVEYNQPLFRIV
jgi:acetyl-CoA carboxylase biotin carboxyl carrier protein